MIHTYDIEEFCDRHDISLDTFDDIIIGALPKLSKEGPWLAGGAIRRLLSGTDPFESDLDFFFTSKVQFDEFEEELKKISSLKKTKDTAGAITYSGELQDKKVIIQLVRIKYFMSMNDLLNSFDFTICQFGWDGEEIHCGIYSLWDLSRKKLAINKVTYGVATVRRMIKYTKQGFTACAGCIKSILDAVANDPTIIQSTVEYVD